MTGDPTQTDGISPEPRLPPESRAARSLTDRSRPEDAHAEEPHPALGPERGPRIWPRVVGVLILLLGAGGAWVWQNPGFIQANFGSLFPGSAPREDAAAAIEALKARVARLEQRPAPPDLAPLTQRVDALEKRPAGTAQSAPTDQRALMARLDALEARAAAHASSPSGSPEPDTGPLFVRLDALEKAVAAHQLDAARIDAITTQVATLTANGNDAEVKAGLADMGHRLSDLAASEARLAEGAAHALRLARLQAASLALESGTALGSIPDVPAALSRFATAAPPTLAALRLAFGPASQSAIMVSKPDTEGKPFLDRVIARLRDSRLITVREGDHVVIGNPAAETLAHAEILLDAGDLAGAVRDVATLTGPPAEKMASWLADATALVAARQALVSLAGPG